MSETFFDLDSDLQRTQAMNFSYADLRELCRASFLLGAMDPDRRHEFSKNVCDDQEWWSRKLLQDFPEVLSLSTHAKGGEWRREYLFQLNQKLFQSLDAEDIDEITFWVGQGASLSVWDNQGLTILERLASKGKLDLIRDLVDLGADIDATDEQGRTVLYYVIDTMYLDDRFKDLVLFLVNLGANVNVSDSTGLTLIERAGDVITGEKIIPILFHAGVTPETKEQQDVRTARFVENIYFEE